jgi:magnesium-transporting ATPase (P-type)
MNYLTTNLAGQTLRLTLNETRQYFAATFTHFLLIITHEENSTAGDSISQVPVIVLENQRITQLTVTTVGLTLQGRYRYYVYGQNSAVNLDPNNAAVVGLCKIGTIELVNSTQYYDVPSITITDDIIYNGNP